jgi:hypothetical protein
VTFLARLRAAADDRQRVPFQTAKLLGAVTIGPEQTADELTLLLLTHQIVLRDASGSVADIDQHPTTPLYVCFA